MRGKPLNTPLLTPEEERELDEMILEGHYRQRQTDALLIRKQEPQASWILRALLLEMIRPRGLQI